MKTDARVRYTHMVIKNSFISLLKQTSLNKISVKSICDMAEINRTTFYKYYDDVYSIIEKIETELLEELQRLIGSISINQNTVVETVETILKKIQTDGDIYATLFSSNGDNLFPSRIFAICYKNISGSGNIKKLFPRLSGVQQEWIYYFFAQGCSGILKQWAGNRMKEPPKKIAAFIGRLFSVLCNEFGNSPYARL
jgi:AcrR family transcriptional regulator